MSEISNEQCRPFQDQSTLVVLAAKEKRNHENDALDEALKGTFPASDPVAIGVTRIGVISSSQ